jgi:hypothetical protein
MNHIEEKRDTYTVIRNRQNAGEPCPYCTSTSGHYVYCDLLSPTKVAVVESDEQKIDNFFLASLRIEAL